MYQAMYKRKVEERQKEEREWRKNRLQSFELVYISSSLRTRVLISTTLELGRKDENFINTVFINPDRSSLNYLSIAELWKQKQNSLTGPRC